jgi:hypothetical protein
MLRRRLLLPAALAVVWAIATPSKGWATFSVTISDGGSNNLTFTDGLNDGDGEADGSITTIASFDGYKFIISASSNSPGQNYGLVTNSTVEIQKMGSSVSDLTLTFTTSSDGFLTSPNPLTTVTMLTSNTFPDSATASGATLINGSVVSDSSVNLTGASQNVQSTTYVSTGTPFILGNQVVISLPAANGVPSSTTVGQVDISSKVIPAPTPSGLILAAGVVPFISLLRRRLRVAV